MPRYFFVIVIDDQAPACEAVARKLNGSLPSTSRDTIVELRSLPVHVRIRQEIVDGRSTWTFHPSMIPALTEAAKQAPDLIIADYFYVADAVSQDMRLRARKGDLTKEEFTRNFLSPSDLRQWVENEPSLDSELRRQILRNLFGASCPVYLHSFTPRGGDRVAGTTDDRLRGLASVFPRATRHVIDTRKEFYCGDEFDNDGRSMHDKEYYVFQLAAFFMQVAQMEVLRKRLDEARFLRLRRTAGSVAAIVTIGAAIGFAAGWAGEAFGALVREGRFLLALMVGIGCFVTLLALGTACPFLFEYLMRRLLREESAD